jgi:hypothetical protein
MPRLKKKLPSDVKDDIAVKGEIIRQLFVPEMAKSTFHDYVNAGNIIKAPNSHGFYLYNATRVNLGLPELDSIALQELVFPDAAAHAILLDALLACTDFDKTICDVFSFVYRPKAFTKTQLNLAIKYYKQYKEKLDNEDTDIDKILFISGVLAAKTAIDFKY